MIEDLVSDLKDDEGWDSHVYKDTEGYLTIGYGFLVDPNKPSEGLPLHIGEMWLEYAAMRRWSRLTAREPWLLELPEKIQRALGNMTYQLGVDGLLEFKKMLAALKSGDYRMARVEGFDSRWAKQTPNRAKRVLELYR